MKNSDFNAVVQDQLGRCEDTLIKKAKEYASDEDRLHNFIQAAHLQGITPRQALAGMMAKHTVSVYDMAMSTETFTPEQWDEKIGDHLNYLLILRAMVSAEETSDGPLADQAALASLREKLRGNQDLITAEQQDNDNIAIGA